MNPWITVIHGVLMGLALCTVTFIVCYNICKRQEKRNKDESKKI